MNSPHLVIPGLAEGENPEPTTGRARDSGWSGSPDRGFRVPLRGPGMTEL
jgi:hypothetical protein